MITDALQRRPIAALLTSRFLGLLLLAALAAYTLPRKLDGAALTFHDDWLLHLFLAAGPYIVSHLFRAARLVILSAPTLRLRVRTLFFLHFHTALIAPFIPFKLEELYRWQQLSSLSGKPLRALMISLLLRTLDAVVLALVCGYAMFTQPDMPSYLETFGFLLVGVACLSLFVFLVAPRGLATVQSYMMKHHFSRRAVVLLGFVDQIRDGIAAASGAMKTNWLLLAVLSLFVWGAELATVALLVPQMGQALDDALIMALSIAMGVGRVVDESFIVWGRSYVIATVFVAVLFWPILTLLYFRLRQSGALVRASHVKNAHVGPRRIALHGFRGGGIWLRR